MPLCKYFTIEAYSSKNMIFFVCLFFLLFSFFNLPSTGWLLYKIRYRKRQKPILVLYERRREKNIYSKGKVLIAVDLIEFALNDFCINRFINIQFNNEHISLFSLLCFPSKHQKPKIQTLFKTETNIFYVLTFKMFEWSLKSHSLNILIILHIFCLLNELQLFHVHG